MTYITKDIKVLIGCEYSGIVREAFNAIPGIEAWSCDLLPTERPSNRHIVADVRDVLGDGWDMLCVFHPPCTRLCNSGVRWLHVPPRGRTLDDMWVELDQGCDLFSDLWNAPIKHKVIENPVMHKHAKERIRNYRDATQTVQPWWFGEPVFKATGLYLDNLPVLVPTNKLNPPKSGTKEHGKWSKVHRASPGPNRWKERSRFFPGIAAAMAEQWGHYVVNRMAEQLTGAAMPSFTRSDGQMGFAL